MLIQMNRLACSSNFIRCRHCARRGVSTLDGSKNNGYQSMGSFHSEDIDALRALPAATYQPPPLPRGLSAIRSPSSNNTTFNGHHHGDAQEGDHELRLQEVIAHAASCEFGREIKAAHFLLDPEWTFVNHGAFGAALRIAHDHAAAWRRYSELQPLRFFDRDLLPHLTHSLRALAHFVKADPQDLVLGPNATSLLNAVVLATTHPCHHGRDDDGTRSSGEAGTTGEAMLPPSLGVGDHVMLLDTAYGGVKKLCEEACRRTGATLEVVPLPLPLPLPGTIIEGMRDSYDDDDTDAACMATAVAAFVEAVAGRVRGDGSTALVVLDHTTSNTALTLPVGAMAEACKKAGARCVLVDGAHGVWAQDLDLPSLGQQGVDFYVGNCHKWLCAPRGAALLWAKNGGLRWRRGGGGGGNGGGLGGGDGVAGLRPAVVSHGYSQGAWSGFAWDGCRDYGAALSLPPLLRFWADNDDGGGGDGGAGGGGGGVGAARGRAYTRALLRDACEHLHHRWAPLGGGFNLAPLRSSLPSAAAAAATHHGGGGFEDGPMALVALPVWRSNSSTVVTRDGDCVATSVDAKRVQDALHHCYRVEAPIKCVGGRLWVRLSAHVYNDLSDYERLGHAVEAAIASGV